MTNEKSIIDVKKIVDNRKEKLKQEIAILKEKGIIPKICVIIANNEEASKVYVNNKKKLCEELGVLYEDYFFKENTTNEDIVNLVNKLNEDVSVHAILIQLPLFKHLDESLILNTISYKKDVDGFTCVNLGKLFIEDESILPCTPKGIMTILESVGETFEGKHAVVVGRSDIVGKPIAHLLLSRNCTVTMCHSKTKDILKYTKEADILVVAVGKPQYINGTMVKKGSTVIDVGINKVDDKIVGDVDTESVSNVARFVTKVPGGVGKTTVLSLVENVVKLAKNIIK